MHQCPDCKKECRCNGDTSDLETLNDEIVDNCECCLSIENDPDFEIDED